MLDVGPVTETVGNDIYRGKSGLSWRLKVNGEEVRMSVMTQVEGSDQFIKEACLNSMHDWFNRKLQERLCNRPD